MRSRYGLGDKVTITRSCFANQEGVVEKIPTRKDSINIRARWLEAGGGEPWGEGPMPDAYNVRLTECDCQDKQDCRHVITFLQEEDLVPALAEGDEELSYSCTA